MPEVSPETLVQQAQALLDSLSLLIRRMDPEETDLEPYNDYYREQVEDLIGMAQERLERRERLVNPTPIARTEADQLPSKAEAAIMEPDRPVEELEGG